MYDFKSEKLERFILTTPKPSTFLPQSAGRHALLMQLEGQLVGKHG